MQYNGGTEENKIAFYREPHSEGEHLQESFFLYSYMVWECKAVRELPEVIAPTPEQWEVLLTSNLLENQRGLVTRAIRAAAGHDIPDQGHHPPWMTDNHPALLSSYSMGAVNVF